MNDGEAIDAHRPMVVPSSAMASYLGSVVTRARSAGAGRTRQQ